MWPFGKIEWKTVKMPLSFLDAPSAAESMTLDFEAVGNPDGPCRFFFAIYSYPGGEASFEDYEKLRKNWQWQQGVMLAGIWSLLVGE